MAILKVIEILSSSDKSWEDATQNGLAKTAKSLKNIKSAYVQNQSVTTDDYGKIKEYRVNLKVSFEVE